MAYSVPLTAVSNAALTASQWNASVRDNILETAVAKATTSGGYPVSTGPNALAERIIGFDSVATAVNHTNTSFSDLTASIGPTVTVTSGARCIGIHSCYLENSNVNAASLTALQISGATTFAAQDNFALSMTSSTANSHLRASYVLVYETTPGSNQFQMKYRVSGGTGQFQYRRLTIQPF